MEALLAHQGHGHGEPLELAVLAIAAMVIPLIVLGFVGRSFWRSAQRDPDRVPREQP